MINRISSHYGSSSRFNGRNIRFIPLDDFTYTLIPNNDLTFTLIPGNDFNIDLLPNNDLLFTLIPNNDILYTIIPNNDGTYLLIPNNDLGFSLLFPTPNPTPTLTPTPTITETLTPTPTLTETPNQIPSLVTNGLIIQLDAHETDSYPGTGTTVYDLINNYDHSLIGSTFTNLNGVKCFDCTTGVNRIQVNGTGPTLPTTGYTYITWTKLQPDNPLSFRTLLYTNSPKYTPITIPNGTNTLGYWDTEFRSSGYNLSSSVDTWVQYAIVGDNSSQKFYINGSEVGSTISFGSGGTTHWGWGNNNVQQPWGHVANLYFYNRKLSLSEITQHYNFLSPRFVEPTPTPTPTSTSTLTPTVTETVTPTITPTITETLTPTVTPTLTLTPTVTSTLTPTPTLPPLDFTISSNCNNNGSITFSNLVGVASGQYQYSSGIFTTESGALNAVSWANVSGGSSGLLIPGASGTYWLAVRDANNPSYVIAKSVTISCVVTSNLILHYDPSNTSSYPGTGTTINDLSGGGRNGTMSNITHTSPYFTYNGTSSQISIPDDVVLEPGTGDFTVETWVYYSVIDGSQRTFISKTDNGGGANDWSYGLRTNVAGATYLEVGNGTTSVTSPSYNVSTGQWYQIVGVWTNVASNSIAIYINGTSQGSNSHSFTSVKNSINPIYLGNYNGNEYQQSFNGRMGITRLYNKALSSSEVLQNFNTDKSKYGL